MRSLTDQEYAQAYLDGELNSEQMAAVEIRLRSDAPFADILMRLARDEAVLTEWARSVRTVSLPFSADTPAPVPFAFPVAVPVAEPVPRRPSIRPRLLLALAGCAAALLVAVVGLRLVQRTPERAPVPELARLEEVQGEVFVVPAAGEPFPAHSGQELTSGQGLSTRGEGSFAVLAVPNTWRLELGADTTIHLPAESPGKKVYLEHGVVAADVGLQPEDRPMIVATAHAEARLVEGKSSFASTSIETRIEPEKGKVRLVRKSDGRTIDVSSGQYAVAAAATDAFAARPLLAQVVTQPRAVLTELAGQSQCAAYSPDGATLAVGGPDGSVKLWNVAAEQVRLTLPCLPGGKRGVRALAFAPGGKLLAVSHDDRTVKLWDPIAGTEQTVLKDFRSTVVALVFAPGGKYLATGCNPGKSNAELRLWDAATWKEVPLPREQVGGVGNIAFSPDGQTMATTGKDAVVKLWDLGLRQVRQTLQTGHNGRVNALIFAPDGRLLTGGKDRSVKVWDLATATEQGSFHVAGCEVRSLAFAPDGSLGVAADQNATLWDLSTKQERLSLKGPKQGIGTLLFAPGGKTLATVGYDKTVRLWDTTVSH